VIGRSGSTGPIHSTGRSGISGRAADRARAATRWTTPFAGLPRCDLVNIGPAC